MTALMPYCAAKRKATGARIATTAGRSAPKPVMIAATRNMIHGMSATCPRPPDGAFDQPVDRSVILGNGEKIGDADQRQKQITGEAGEYVIGHHSHDQETDDEGAGKGQCIHVDRQDGCGNEHANQDKMDKISIFTAKSSLYGAPDDGGVFLIDVAWASYVAFAPAILPMAVSLASVMHSRDRYKDCNIARAGRFSVSCPLCCVGGHQQR